MASTNQEKTVKVTLEMVEGAREYIRRIVREEIEAYFKSTVSSGEWPLMVKQEIEDYMKRAVQSRGWQPVKEWPPIEKKVSKHE